MYSHSYSGAFNHGSSLHPWIAIVQDCLAFHAYLPRERTILYAVWRSSWLTANGEEIYFGMSSHKRRCQKLLPRECLVASRARNVITNAPATWLYHQT